MTLTKGQINKLAVQELRRRRVDAWVQGNARTVRGHTFKGRPGVSDTIGVQLDTGVFVACEVKTLNDRLSDAQRAFLKMVKEAGGIALIATEDRRTGNMVIMDYYEYINQPGRNRKGDHG